METKKPKFAIGDRVFLICEDRVQERVVTGVVQTFDETFGPGDPELLGNMYFLSRRSNVKDYGWFDEDRLFQSREDLIARL